MFLFVPECPQRTSILPTSSLTLLRSIEPVSSPALLRRQRGLIPQDCSIGVRPEPSKTAPWFVSHLKPAFPYHCSRKMNVVLSSSTESTIEHTNFLFDIAIYSNHISFTFMTIHLNASISFLQSLVYLYTVIFQTHDKNREVLKSLKSHVILCAFAEDSSPLIGLCNFVMPLRSSCLRSEELKAVVIVGNEEFLQKEWEGLQHFPKVYVKLVSMK